jgi:uncharacterized membrane protein
VAELVAPRAYRPRFLPAAADTSTNLVVPGPTANYQVGGPGRAPAHDVWAELVKLGHDYLADLQDAAIIWRDENGKVHVTTPAHHAVANGTVSGLFRGTLIGLLFMFPLAPLAGVAGGIMGAALGAAWRLGIKDDFRQRVQDLVQPGTSALMVIVRKTTPEKFTEALRPYGGTVLKTSLPRDAELELMKALRQPGLTHLDQSSAGVPA